MKTINISTETHTRIRSIADSVGSTSMKQTVDKLVDCYAKLRQLESKLNREVPHNVLVTADELLAQGALKLAEAGKVLRGAENATK